MGDARWVPPVNKPKPAAPACEGCGKATVTRHYAYVSDYRWHAARLCYRCASEEPCVGPTLADPEKPTQSERNRIEVAMRCAGG